MLLVGMGASVEDLPLSSPPPSIRMIMKLANVAPAGAWKSVLSRHCLDKGDSPVGVAIYSDLDPHVATGKGRRKHEPVPGMDAALAGYESDSPGERSSRSARLG